MFDLTGVDVRRCPHCGATNSGRRIKAAHKRIEVAVRDALKVLKAERLAQGLSLSDVEERSGIGRAALSRLENETEANPTVMTLTRYAEALGKKLVVSFE